MPLSGFRRWGVALICSVLNFLHLGMARLSGSMYLAVLERYHVDRSQAALPFILCYTVRNISGPLVGYLATKIGIYTVTMLGGLLAFVGIGCCYFAEDIIVVILFWGVVFGFGFGMGSVLLPEILNHHFDKYVSNANGVAFGGECIAGFVLPIFLKYSLNAYGTSGTFLILSSLMLNSIPATLLLKYFSHNHSSKAPHVEQNKEHMISGNELHCSINRSNSNSFETEDRSSETTKLLKEGLLTPKPSEAKYKFILMGSSSISSGNEKREEIFDEKSSNINNKSVYSENSKENRHQNLKQRNIAINCQDNGKNIMVNQSIDTFTQTSSNQYIKVPVLKESLSHSYPERKSKHTTYLETNISNPSTRKAEYVPIKYYGSLDEGIPFKEKNRLSDLQVISYEKSTDSFSNHDKSEASLNIPTSSFQTPSTLVDAQTSPSSPFKIFFDPAFCMILLTQSTMLFSVTMFWTIIVDFSRDTGLSSKEEIYVLICLSVLDMAGRLGLGWITDAGYMSNSKFSGICCFGMGISIGTLVFFKTVATIGSSVSVFGLFFGGFLIVCPGVVNDHISQDKRGMALASRFFLFAPMSLSQSPMIGYFRGKLGSYKFIFIILAILCLFSSVTSLLTPYAAKCRDRRKGKTRILGRNFDTIISAAGSAKQLVHDSFTKIDQPLSSSGRINRAFLEA